MDETNFEISEEETKAEVAKYSDGVSEQDVKDMSAREEKMKGFFRHVGALTCFWDDVCDIFNLLRDRVSGRYTVTPWRTIASLVGALLYVLAPLDLCPDFIPIGGFLDDAAVIGFVIKLTHMDLDEYREWKKSQAEVVEAEPPSGDL